MIFLAKIFGSIMAYCYSFLGNYGMAIVIFTFFTKIILLPVSLWTQRNSIKMVELTPDLNRLKARFYGDKESLAEETQWLYKQHKYSPFVSLVPMVVQLILLFGVIGAVRELLGESGSLLAEIPVQDGGVVYGMPVLAGLSALALGLAQNHLNPLQREQKESEQIFTNSISIGISLALGAFVPIGVGLYWICSNLFTIAQQIVLNAIIKPEKYIDYEALAASKRELAEIEQLSAGISKEDKKREKADYKRFFKVANKHLVFYSEKSGFYKYFQGVIEELLKRSNITIHYVTSDPKDQVFELAKNEPRLHPYYIGEKRLITLMMKMDADIVVMTMPDLDNFHIKRSYVRKNIEYVFMFHGPLSMHMAMRKGCVDNFDTIFSVGRHTTQEVRKTEDVYGLKHKNIVECGYGFLEKLRADYLKYEKNKSIGEVPKILIAPSWQPGNIMEHDIMVILDKLKEHDFEIVVRPHPQYIKHYFNDITALQLQYEQYRNIVFQIDFVGDESIFEADLLISDWSGIAYEFAFATEKPVLFVNTPMKIMNPEYMKLDIVPLEITLRNQVGISIDENNLAEICESIVSLLNNGEKYAKTARELREKYFYSFGKSSEVCAKYILNSLLDKQKNH